MSLFTFGAPPLAQDDNPEIEIQNLQIGDYQLQGAAGGSNSLQVAAGGANAVQVAAGGGGAGSGSGVGSGSGSGTNNFPLVNYYSDVKNPDFSYARMSFVNFIVESKNCLTFGGTTFLTCGSTSNALKTLNSSLHMQYLHMVDTHLTNTKSDPYVVNQFLFGTSKTFVHQSRNFRVFHNFRDYIFKPVFSALYSVQIDPEAIPESLIDREEDTKMEMFSLWLKYA